MSEVLNSLPNKQETSRETNLQKLGKTAFKAVKDFFNPKNSIASEQVSETTATPAETKPYRHAPDLSRIEDGHTKEEMDKLQKKWENWLNGGSVLSDNLENTLEAVYDDEKNNWGYDELDTFFDNCKDIRSNIEKRGSKDGKTIADKISSTLDNNKELFGINSKTYVAATEDTILSITKGKYKGARLSYDDFPQAKIILGNQYGEITKDDKKRYGTTIGNFYLEDDD
jgi:hypothetical protein